MDPYSQTYSLPLPGQQWSQRALLPLIPAPVEINLHQQPTAFVWRASTDADLRRQAMYNHFHVREESLALPSIETPVKTRLESSATLDTSTDTSSPSSSESPAPWSPSPSREPPKDQQKKKRGTAPRHRATTTPTESPRTGRGIGLHKDEETILLRLLYSRRELYDRPKEIIKFWSKLNEDLSAEIGRRYTNARYALDEIEERYKAAADVATGEEPPEDSWFQAAELWFGFLNDHREQQEQTKKQAARAQREASRSAKVREDLTFTKSGKRKQREVEQDEADSAISDIESGEEPEDPNTAADEEENTYQDSANSGMEDGCEFR